MTQNNQTDLSPYLGINQAAGYLQISISKLYKLVHVKSIRYTKHGSKVMFLRRWLDDWSLNSVVPPQNTPEASPLLLARINSSRRIEKKRSLKIEDVKQGVRQRKATER